MSLVSLGGGLGGVARYGLSVLAPGAWGLFLINVLGSFLIGVLMGLVPRPLVRAFFGVGLLGGFTTFSAYAVLVAQRLDDAPLWSFAYAAGTVAASVAAAAVGVTVGSVSEATR